MHGNTARSPSGFSSACCLTIYGVLILGPGIYNYNVAVRRSCLSNLHAPVWWGAFLLGVGLVYLIRFFPRKQQ